MDVERDGIRQTPLPFIASNGLSLMKRELIDQCVYTRGIHQLEYPEMRKMIRCAFGTLENVCCIFVHKMNGYSSFVNLDIQGLAALSVWSVTMCKFRPMQLQ